MEGIIVIDVISWCLVIGEPDHVGSTRKTKGRGAGSPCRGNPGCMSWEWKRARKKQTKQKKQKNKKTLKIISVVLKEKEKPVPNPVRSNRRQPDIAI